MDDLIIELGENLQRFLLKKQIGKRTGVTSGIDRCAEDIFGRQILAIVKRHANVVSGASLASAIPGVGTGITMTAVIASTWKMYYDINQEIGLSFTDNFLKSVASGVVSNLASNGLALAGNTVLSCIPGIGSVAAVAGSVVITRTSLHAAAVSYLKILGKIAETGGSLNESTINQQLSKSGNNKKPSSTSNSPSLTGYHACSAQHSKASYSSARTTSNYSATFNASSYITSNNTNWDDACRKAVNLLYGLENCSKAERHSSLYFIESIDIKGSKKASWDQIKRIWKEFAERLEVNTKALPNPDGVLYVQRPFPIKGSVGVQDLIKEIIRLS